MRFSFNREKIMESNTELYAFWEFVNINILTNSSLGFHVKLVTMFEHSTVV